MAAPNNIPFDPELLQRHSIISGFPSWKQVNEALRRLQQLQQPGANPYDEMELDRDNALQFENLLERSADSIAYAICLAAHLARFSNTKVFEQRLNEGFQALSTGLGLPLLRETEIREDLQRCVRAAFSDLGLEFPPLSAPVAAAPAVTPSPEASAAAVQPPAEHPPHSEDVASARLPKAPKAHAPAESVEPAVSAPPTQATSNASPSPAPETTAKSAESEPAPPHTILPFADQRPTPSPAAEPQSAPPQAANPSAESQPSAPATPPPSAEPSKPVADPWRLALERALAKIAAMDPMPRDEIRQRAEESWQARLLSVLPLQGQPAQPEILPDIDYLRCRAANDPLGTVLHGRLRNTTLREWNEVYVYGMATTGVPTPLPLWFALAALGMLGFDIPRDIPTRFAAEVPESFAKIPTTNATKGLLIIRLTADSQTTEWKISPSVPALILTAEDFQRDNKLNLQPYLQLRLHGVLIELGRDEAPNASRPNSLRTTLAQLMPSIRVGFLAFAQLTEQARSQAGGAIAVRPSDAGEAYTQAFASTSPPGAATSSAKA